MIPFTQKVQYACNDSKISCPAAREMRVLFQFLVQFWAKNEQVPL